MYTTPNDWDDCFYGSIAFKVNWKPTNQTKFDWVGFTDQGDDTKYRILVTENKKFDDFFDRYYPEKHIGPLWLENGKWYYNGKSSIKGEFLFDRQIDFSEWRGIKFSSHRFCIQNGTGCKEIGIEMCDAGAQFISYILGMEITYIGKLITEERCPSLPTALYRLSCYYSDEKGKGGLERDEELKIYKESLLLLSSNLKDDDAYEKFKML